MDLRRAIARDELQLHYQPIVKMQTQETVGFEALVRMQHPTRGVLSPNHFIPIAEETGLIVAFGGGGSCEKPAAKCRLGR
jgi:EAL domain-containing protein (putative c-di-GMP-specific phosphodiesterase class I)